VPFAFVLGVLFLDFGLIEQYDLGDLRRCGGAVYPASKTVSDKLWQESAMVEMGVCEQDGVDRIGRDNERLEVPCFEISLLVEPAVDEDLGSVNFEHVARAGDVLSGAEKT